MDNALGHIPLFRGIPVAERQTIAPLCELRRFRKGEVIFEEGRPATDVWVVKRGWIYLMKQTPHGGQVTIFTMTPDEALCGISAFDHGAYAATATAATDTQLIRIPAGAFAELLQRHPAFSQQVLLTCCNRIRHMADAISLAQAPVEVRISYTLLRLRAAFGNTVPVTHQELARMAGTRLETSIRTIAGLKRKGWLATSRGKMTVLHPAKLKGLIPSSATPEYGTHLLQPDGAPPLGGAG